MLTWDEEIKPALQTAMVSGSVDSRLDAFPSSFGEAAAPQARRLLDDGAPVPQSAPTAVPA
jgi:hypothetical protein